MEWHAEETADLSQSSPETSLKRGRFGKVLFFSRWWRGPLEETFYGEACIPEQYAVVIGQNGSIHVQCARQTSDVIRAYSFVCVVEKSTVVIA
jgi:hypothetical protein